MNLRRAWSRVWLNIKYMRCLCQALWAPWSQLTQGGVLCVTLLCRWTIQRYVYTYVDGKFFWASTSMEFTWNSHNQSRGTAQDSHTTVNEVWPALAVGIGVVFHTRKTRVKQENKNM